MYHRMGDIPSYYERGSDQSANQVTDLQYQIADLTAQINEKDNIINQLKFEISQLKAQLNQTSHMYSPPSPHTPTITPPPVHTPHLKPPPVSVPAIPPPNSNLNLNPPPSTNYQTEPITNPPSGSTTNKRKCPYCGAMGFAIKEFDDKTKIISYVPRRIYAKKKVCTKCRNEF